ncbi:MAG: hypothetical protein PHU85_18500, partial [Phycisphaerae bacterium]|nr:hypothetical protein [Phycisphaerae bacterium]
MTSRRAALLAVSLSAILAACQDVATPPPQVRQPGILLYEEGDEANNATFARMAKVVSFDVDHVQFEKAIAKWSALTGVDIVPNWAAMEAVGITKSTEVAVHLKNVMAETAWEMLLARAAGKYGVLDYMVRNGLVKVSTTEDLNSLKYIRIYDVRDLRVASAVWEAAWTQRYVDLMPKGVAKKYWTYSAPDGRRWVESFLTLLRSSILPDTWAPSGDAQVLESDGLLIVKQSSNGHRQISQLLMQLRAAYAAGSPRPPAYPRQVLSPDELHAARRWARAETQPDDELSRRIGWIRFSALAFNDALNQLARAANVNLAPDWTMIEARTCGKNTEITLSLDSPTFETALRELLTKAAGREGVLDYDYVDGVLRVSNVDELSTRKPIRIYDIRDLMAARDLIFSGEMRGRAPVSSPPPRPGELEESRVDNGLFRGGGEADYRGEVAPYSSGEARDRAMNSFLLTLLRVTVLPDSWAPSGDSNIFLCDGLLVVKQTAAGHRELRSLLTKLRGSYAAGEKALQPD